MIEPKLRSALPTLLWMLVALALTSFFLVTLVLDWSSVSVLVALAAAAVAWLMLVLRVTRGVPAGQDALAEEEQRVLGALRQFVGREVDGARAEIERTRALVRAAVAELNRSFAEMERESRAQGATVTTLVEQGQSTGAGPPGLRQFAVESEKLTESLAAALAESGRQGVVTVGRIDEMAACLDAIFDGLATADAAPAAPMRDRVGLARRAVADVRAMVELAAERDMNASVEAKLKGDALHGEVQRVNQLLTGGILAVSASGARIRDSVGAAVRAMQFEDITTQSLAAASVHLERLQDINRDATELQKALTDPKAPPEARIRAIEDFLQRLRSVHDAWAKPIHKAVAQVDLKAGTVELF